MNILGIESSCDESAVSLISFREKVPTILSEEISSQVDLHQSYGGVVPELASREHLRNLPLLLERARSAGSFDAVAVTRGPGLKGCLLVGLEMAKGLACGLSIPLLGVNHIEGHLFAPFLAEPSLSFPYLALIVSGGHTEIVEVQGVGQYRIHARTIDDAAGEAFDKAANLLGFQYPGGAKLAALADSFSPVGKGRFSLPKVMRESPGFSFSGLKTAILLLVRAHPEVDRDEALRAEIAWTIQESIVDALLFKLAQAIKDTGISRVVVTGGVSANRRLREGVQKLRGVSAVFPSPKHCMDNASMIALIGGLRILEGERSELSITAISRWPLEEMKPPPQSPLHP